MNILRSLSIFFVITVGSYIVWVIFWGIPDRYIGNKVDYWKVNNQEQFDIVFMGDSRATFDINPFVINKKLPLLSVVNLGFSAANFAPDYYNFISSKVKNNGSVVLGINLYKFFDGFRNHSFVDYYNNNKSFSLSGYIPNYDDFYSIFLRHAGANVRYRSLGKSHICALDCQYDDHRSDEGYKDISRYKLSSKRIDDFISWVASLRKSNMNIYFFRMPTAQCHVEYEKQIKNFSYKELSKSLKEVGAVELNIENKYRTYDGSHLNCKWADIFSNDLADELARAMNYKKAED